MHTTELFRIIRLFEDAHRGQVRKYTGEPYFNHCLRVMGRTILHPEAGFIQAISSSGHDVFEDVKWATPQWALDNGVPELSVMLMLALTNPSKKHPQLSRKERKRMDRDHVKGGCVWTKRIKMIDCNDNVIDFMRNDINFLRDVYLRESWSLFEVMCDADDILASELALTLKAAEKLCATPKVAEEFAITIKSWFDCQERRRTAKQSIEP